MIDGPSCVPLPGTAYSRPSGQLALSRPLPEPGHAGADLVVRRGAARASRSWRRRTRPSAGSMAMPCGSPRPVSSPCSSRSGASSSLASLRNTTTVASCWVVEEHLVAPVVDRDAERAVRRLERADRRAVAAAAVPEDDQRVDGVVVRARRCRRCAGRRGRPTRTRSACCRPTARAWAP